MKFFAQNIHYSIDVLVQQVRSQRQDKIQDQCGTLQLLDTSRLVGMLRQGRVLLLLDGLDEVLDRDRNAVLKEIRRFSKKYQKNLFVANCRTTAQTFKLRGFRDVEIAPFTQTPHLAPRFALACTLDQGMLLDTALDNLVLECAIDEVNAVPGGNIQENVDSSSDFAHAHALNNALSNALAIVLDVGLHQSLQQLKDQLPDPEQDRERFQALLKVV